MKIRKSSFFAIIILVNGLFFALGMICATWLTNQRSTKSEYAELNVVTNTVKTDEHEFTEQEIELFESFYLPAFVATTNSETYAQGIINSLIYNLNVTKMDKTAYKEYSTEGGVEIYSKDSVDTASNELLGSKASQIITSADSMKLDEKNDLYVISGNDASTSYEIAINDYYMNNDGNIVFDIEYCEISDSELLEYESQYIIDHQISVADGNDDFLNEEVWNSYIASKEKKAATITVKTNTDYSYANYQLVSVETK